VLILGALAFSVQGSEQQQAELAKADALYATGNDAEEALAIYRALATNESTEVYVILSKLRIAYILDEQLMQYEQAVDAYQRFIDDYPKNRLTQIVSSKVQQLQKLKTTGTLGIYQEYKMLERDYTRNLQNLDASPAERDRVALQLYHFAKTNLTVSFNQEIFDRAIAALIQEKRVFKADELIKLGEAGAALRFSSEDVREEITKTYMALVSGAILLVCLLCILFGRGFVAAYGILKANALKLCWITAGLFLYLLIYHFVLSKTDASTSWKPLFSVMGQCLLLIPSSVLLFCSFSYIKNRVLRLIVIGTLSLLMGVSSWVLFMYYFKFLLVTRM